MNIDNYEVLLFDAANTLIHKPDLWKVMLGVLNNNGIKLNELELRKRHKVLSEIIRFPDRTSKDFYRIFNYEVLLSLGIIADEYLLNEIFVACSYLPWKSFEDTKFLEGINKKKAVLSNFNSTLEDHIKQIFGGELFCAVIGSEIEGIGKPDTMFYKQALKILDVHPSKVLYIGDSLKLDIVPAQSIGIEAWLIDRDSNFTHFNKRISSLEMLNNQ